MNYREEIEADPNLSLAELARRHGVTRQAVSAAILRDKRRNGESTERKPLYDGPVVRWRKRLGISQAVAADALGISRRWLQYIESNDRKMPHHVKLYLRKHPEDIIRK